MTRLSCRWICRRRRHAAARRRARAGCRYRQLCFEPIEDRVLLSTLLGAHPRPAVWNVDVGPAVGRWGAMPAVVQAGFDSAAVSFNLAASPALRVAAVADGGPDVAPAIAGAPSEPATRPFDGKVAVFRPLDGEVVVVRPLADSVDYRADAHSAIDRATSTLALAPPDAGATPPEMPAGLAGVLSDGGFAVEFSRAESSGDRFDAQASWERPPDVLAGMPVNSELPTDERGILAAVGHLPRQMIDGQFAASPTDAGATAQVAVGSFATEVTEQVVDSQVLDGRIFAELASDSIEPTSSIGGADAAWTAVDLQQMADSRETGSAVARSPVEPASTLIDLGSTTTNVGASEGGLIDIGTSLSNNSLLMSIDAIGENPLMTSSEPELFGRDLEGSPTDSVTRAETAADRGSEEVLPSTLRITPTDDGRAAVPEAEHSTRREETDKEAVASDSEDGGATEGHLTAIAPADLASEESEGGLIDLTCVVNEPVRLAGGTVVEPEDASAGLADGEQVVQATTEELAVDGSRGRSQVFELAMATGPADGASELRTHLDQTAPIGHLEATAPFVALPDSASSDQVSSEEAASAQSGAHETVFAEMAGEDADARSSTASQENQNHWSASLLPLLGPVAITLGVAERAAYTRRQKRRALRGLPR